LHEKSILLGTILGNGEELVLFCCIKEEKIREAISRF
jgi:hypothetical protein